MSKKEKGKRPVTLSERRKVWENSLFSVYEDDLSFSDGTSVERYLHVSPKGGRKNLIYGVGILPVDKQGRIGLLRNYRHIVGAELWEIPGGFVDNNETPTEAASRELLEETGLECEGDRLGLLGTFTPDAGTLSARVAMFVAERFTVVRPYVPAETGHIEFCWFEPDEVKKMMADSVIEDACTLIAIYKYMMLINEVSQEK